MSVDTRTPAPAKSPATATRAVNRLFLARELGIAAALVILVIATSIANPRFLTAQSIKDLLLGSTILAIMAVGQAIVVITRNVDLSVGSILGLSAFAPGSLFVAAPGTPIGLAVVLGLGLGAVCGA